MAERIDANPEAFVVGYRDVTSRMESATDELSRAEWQGVAQRLRQAWRDWQGEDSLHEMAFGEATE
jgi:hypothetical protein